MGDTLSPHAPPFLGATKNNWADKEALHGALGTLERNLVREEKVQLDGNRVNGNRCVGGGGAAGGAGCARRPALGTASVTN